MKLEFIIVGGIPVPVAVDENEPRHIDQEQLFTSTEGREEARNFGIKNKMEDDK